MSSRVTMKLSIKQVRNLLEDLVAHPRGDLGQNIAFADFPIVVSYQGRSEIAYDQDDLDDILDDVAPPRGPGVPYSLDTLSDMEPDEIPVGAEIEAFAEGVTRITKRQLRRIIKEAYGTYGNPPPPQSSNWRAFADALDIGVLDLDEMAYSLGFTDFYDMDISISPRALASRDSRRFIQAAQASSLAAQEMSFDEILTHADARGGM